MTSGQPAASSGDRPYVDAQSLTGREAAVYEAVATLEFSGRPVTPAEVAASTDLDAGAAGEVLQALTERGVLVRRPGGEAVELARRDWSAAPDTPSR